MTQRDPGNSYALGVGISIGHTDGWTVRPADKKWEWVAWVNEQRCEGSEPNQSRARAAAILARERMRFPRATIAGNTETAHD